jgi:hypothetical protein
MPWGGRKCQKSSILGRGVPGGGIYKFFEISALFAKAPPFSTPNIDPHKGPYGKPHSPPRGCAFAPMGGVKKVTFWGVGGRTARTEKFRHYYIAKTGTRGPKIDQI